MLIGGTLLGNSRDRSGHRGLRRVGIEDLVAYGQDTGHRCQYASSVDGKAQWVKCPGEREHGRGGVVFDHVVLTHCSWYFASLGQLRDTLARVRPWARRLWFTEWDLTPVSGDRLAHFLAVLIQGQIEAAGLHGQGNVRTPFSREGLLRLLPEAGWTVDGIGSVDTEELQDGDWEIAACLDLAGTEERLATLPEAVRQLVLSQVDVLRAIAKPRDNCALAAYSVTAR